MKVVVVGATGAVGSVIMQILENRRFPLDELLPVASPRSVGRQLGFDGRQLEVVALERDAFEGADVALFDVPDELAREWAPVAAAAGAIVVDNSAAFRMDPDVPLVVPEVNAQALERTPKGIVASPNCTTLAMIVAVNALHLRAGLKRLILASYQAVSGAGRAGVEELRDQLERVVKEPEEFGEGLGRNLLNAGETFSHPVALNVVPQCGSFMDDGYTSEELKLRYETTKILGLEQLHVTATCVRVPVVIGHGVAVHAEFEGVITPEEARAVLGATPGIEVADDPEHLRFPTPLEAAGRDPCYVGRVRQDQFDPRALEMFCVADNLRKGAALNTVQIAELLAH
ncbi:MAG: aspartate-semialdehyde dehydrogenase [Actinomycetota bacterium]|jgi:aspartate-semialdehyde dehydrogenase|nr:aspartate-semialdehyde dehydrogenase [Actinomycetota bacterium]